MSVINMPGPRLLGFRWARLGTREQLTANPGELYLRSLSSSFELKGGPMEAKCHHDSEYKPDQGPSPHPEHPGCGFYSYYDPIFMKDESGVSIPLVVMSWGRIIPGQTGCRTQYQQILAIGNPYVDERKEKIAKLAEEEFGATLISVPQLIGGASQMLLWRVSEHARRLYGVVRITEIDERYRVMPAPKTPALPKNETKCACGCGLYVPPGTKFVNGHAKLVTPPAPPAAPAPQQRATISCLCGCGTPVSFAQGYAPGHSPSSAHTIPSFWIPSFCRCGCGGQVYSGQEYIPGHKPSVAPKVSTFPTAKAKRARPLSKEKCGCGCGMPVTEGREFAHGHALRLRAKLAEIVRRPWKDRAASDAAYEELKRRGWENWI